MFPLYEVENGDTYTHSVNTKDKPGGEYLTMQKRYRPLSEQAIQNIQAAVDADWERMLLKANLSQ